MRREVRCGVRDLGSRFQRRILFPESVLNWPHYTLLLFSCDPDSAFLLVAYDFLGCRGIV